MPRERAGSGSPRNTSLSGKCRQGRGEQAGGRVTAGHRDSPPLHGLRLCSASEALIKEGPQQVFENLFLPTVL